MDADDFEVIGTVAFPDVLYCFGPQTVTTWEMVERRWWEIWKPRRYIAWVTREIHHRSADMTKSGV